MITDHALKNHGLYVEGRWFDDNFKHARSFAFALACEYMRPVSIVYNSPAETPKFTEVLAIQPVKAAA